MAVPNGAVTTVLGLGTTAINNAGLEDILHSRAALDPRLVAQEDVDPGR